MKNIEETNKMKWWRVQYLECVRIALKFYKLTKQQNFYDYAKYFSQEAKNLRERIEQKNAEI